MLSRVAESIYWMSRYVERAENIARFIDVNLNMMLDAADPSGTQWQPLINATGDEDLFAKKYGDPTRENVIDFLTFDADYPNSILSCLKASRENARSVRETISSEMWEAINRFYLMVTEAARTPDALESPQAFFMEIKNASHMFAGASISTMIHGEGWNFSRLGSMIERADKTSRVLDVKYFYLLPNAEEVGSTVDELQWSAVLRSVSALTAYRQRYPRIRPAAIVEFLVLNRQFPRSVHHCLIEAEERLRSLTGSAQGTYTNTAEHKLGRLRSEFDYTQTEEILRQGLHEFIDALQLDLNSVSTAIRENFFDLKAVYSGSDDNEQQ